MQSRYLVAAAAAALVSSAPAMAEPFSGPYVGVEIGVDNYEISQSDLFFDGDQYDGLSGNGVVGGIYAGYDFALGSRVFAGIEGNASLSDAKITYDDTIDTLTAKAKESFGASARLGAMLNDNAGIYGRVGWVNTKFKGSYNDDTESDHDDALVLGAGLETRIGENASIRVEYTYADYTDYLSNNQIRAGVGFRF